MRSISSTLLDAASRWGGRPVLRLDVQDHRPRWRTLLTSSAAGHHISQIVVEMTCLVRARCGSDGLSIARVYQPEINLSQWTSWTVQHTQPLATSDVALTIVGLLNSSTCMRAFFFKQNGTLADLMVTESANSFRTTVTTATTVCSGLPQNGWLAAADDCVFYGNSGSPVRVWRKPWGSGAWTEQANWGLGNITVCYGLGACFDTSNRCNLLVAHDGRITAGLYTPAGNTWSDLQQIAPGGAAPSGQPCSHRLPSICYAADRVLAAWVEALDVAHLRYQAVCFEATSFPHLGNEVAVAIGGNESWGRPNLAYHWGEYTMYAADERSACVRPRYRVAPGSALEVLDLPVMSYHQTLTTEGSRLEVRLLNEGGRYNHLGAAGDPYEALKPHSTLLLRRGYVTSAGEETVALPPHYVTSLRLHQGRGDATLLLTAVDGWGLLSAWRAVEATTWRGKTVRWLLAELLARVGLAYSDNGSGNLAYVVPSYTVSPGQSAAHAARDLLDLVGCVALWREAGLYALPVTSLASSSPIALGQQREIVRGDWVQQAPEATSCVTYGDGVDAHHESAAASMALGLRLRRVTLDARIATDAAAEDANEAALALGLAAARREQVAVPLHPEAELWDPVALYRAAPLADGTLRRIVGIEEVASPDEGTFESRLTLEGA